MTEDLDARGLLDTARGPGVYGLEVEVPDDLRSAWHEHNDETPPNLGRMATAECALYVGASGHVYDRLCDHAAADKRRANALKVFPPTRVAFVEPFDAPLDREYGVALAKADARTAVLCDGEIL